MEEKNQSKEDFCPICVTAVPLAFGLSAAVNNNESSPTKEDDEEIIDDEIDYGKKISKFNNLIKWISILLLIIGMISLIIILRSK